MRETMIANGYHVYSDTIAMHFNHYHINIIPKVGVDEEDEEELPEWDDVDGDDLDDGILYGVGPSFFFFFIIIVMIDD